MHVYKLPINSPRTRTLKGRIEQEKEGLLERPQTAGGAVHHKCHGLPARVLWAIQWRNPTARKRDRGAVEVTFIPQAEGEGQRGLSAVSQKVAEGTSSGDCTGVWLGAVIIRQPGVLKLRWRHRGKGRRRLGHEVWVETTQGEAGVAGLNAVATKQSE